MMLMNKTTVSGYDSDLNDLTSRLSDLGSLAEGMLSDAMTAIRAHDEGLARSVIDRDKLANRFQAKIDEDAIRILALRSPMATDLRRTVGAIRVATDLERVGDLSEGIAKRALAVGQISERDIVRQIIMMGRQVQVHLSNALNGLLKDDIDTARQTWMADHDIDDMYAALLDSLISKMSSDPRIISDCTALLFVAKNLERIGDHVSNICEVVYFTLTGRQLIDDEAIIWASQNYAIGSD